MRARGSWCGHKKLEYLFEISFYNIYSAFVKGFTIHNRGPCMQLEQSLIELEKNMSWSKALIYVTSFSYLGAVTTSIGGFPLLTNVHPVSQAILFLCLFFILLSSFKYRKMKWVLSAVYGIAAILSFSGLSQWASYFGGPSLLGPAMAAWDLILAMALLLD